MINNKLPIQYQIWNIYLNYYSVVEKLLEYPYSNMSTSEYFYLENNN